VHAAVLGRLATTLAAAIPLISTQHHAYHPKQRTTWYRLERRTRPLTDAIIAISSAVRSELSRTGFRGRIEHIPTGIDVDRQKQLAQGRRPMDAPYLLTVGHCRNGQKGHDVFLNAFAIAGSRFPNLRAVIVGDGPERDSLEALAQKLGIAERVWFAGERLDVPNLMAHCELFVLPSRWEGLGRVVLEAMALRVCVVATEVEGLAELIDSANSGVLIKPEDVSALASAITLLLDAPDRRVSYGQQAETVVRERFSSREMCQRIVALYRELAVATLGRRRSQRLWRAARVAIHR
jgi:glycosyltransferase involved in cell wall biosynthesis